MARIVTETFVCDICGRQVDREDYISVQVLVGNDAGEDDGEPHKPQYVREDLGLCWDCLDRATVVYHDVDGKLCIYKQGRE